MKICMYVVVFALVTSMAAAQVTVSIPYRVCKRDSTINVPLYIRNVTGKDVLAFQFTVAFNKAVVKVVDIVTAGTISGASGWTVLPNAYADSMKVGAFGASALVGVFDTELRDTVLLKLKCTSTGNLNDTCRLQLRSFMLNAGTPTVIVSSDRFQVGTTAVEGPNAILPTEFILSQNYPNPFNPSTVIQFAVPTRSHVTLALFNPLAEVVRVLVDQEMEAGYHDVVLDAAGLSSGTYFYQMKAGDVVRTKRLVLLK